MASTSRESPQERAPWEGIPSELVRARVLQHLSKADTIAVGSVAGVVLDLIVKGAVEDAKEVVVALDEALARTGEKGDGDIAAITYAKELIALPGTFPQQLRKVLAQDASLKRFGPAAAAIRRYRVIHLLSGPALVATLRRCAPELAKKAIPKGRRDGRRLAAIAGSAAMAMFLAFKFTVSAGRSAVQKSESTGPAWGEPSAGAPADQMLEASEFLEFRAEFTGARKVQIAAGALSEALEERPLDCARVSRGVEGVHQSLQGTSTHELRMMIGPKVLLLRMLPRVCPEQSISP